MENTGAHIEQADVDRIFEPFYRVEQSHSRGIGGSGLGLYIVKGIFDRHDIPFLLTNTSQGVCFTVKF